MINNYKNTEFQLYGYLIQLRELFKTNNIGQLEVEKINGNTQLIESRKFNVAVMGEFKRGKSSLINAMLGLNILPADVTPATATINRITYGNEPSMTIFYHDGKEEAADMNNISDYVTMLTEEGLKRAGQIREAVIHYPTVICQNHVDIIDTPGLNDNADMTRITMSMLLNIDAVIVVVSALSPFSEKETEFVCQLIKSDNIENIVFVVTYIDQIDEDEQDKLIEYIHNRIRKNVSELIQKENNTEEVLIKAKRLLDNSLIFGVSSLLALKSFVTGDRGLLKRSRFEIFKTELYELLTSQQGLNMIIKAIKGIRNASNEFDELCSSKIHKLEQDLYVIDHETAIINNYCNEYKKRLETAFQSDKKQLKECLNGILKLENTFMNNFASSFYKVQGKGHNEIINALSSEAARCFTIASEEYAAKVKKQIFDIFTYIMEGYCGIRNSELIEPVHELNKILNFNYMFSECFDMNMTEIMTSFGFPKFSWQVSPIPNAQFLYNYNILDNVKYAVHTSVQKLYEHWNIYVNEAEKWWHKQIDNEALSIRDAMINNASKEIIEQKKNELFLLRNTYSGQKNTIQDIRMKTDAIYNDLF